MNALEIFNFEGQEIRIFIIDGELWAVGKDVVGLFGYERTADAIAQHCKNARSVRDFSKVGASPTFNLHPQTKLINEGDINRLIFSSKLPIAETIRDWWFEEVLPTIRKTGSYSLQPQLLVEEVLKAYAVFESSLRVAKLIHFGHNRAVLSANEATLQLTGTDVLELIGANLITEPTNKEEFLTVTEVGKRLNLSARRTNSLLELAGFQTSYRDKKGRLCWELTEKGKNYAIYVYTSQKQTNANSEKKIKWSSEIVHQLKAIW